MNNFDGDPIRYPGVSLKYRVLRHGPIAVAICHVIGGSDSRMRPGYVMKAITELFAEGKTLEGATPAPYEIGQWKNRYFCEIEPIPPVSADTYFAWVSDEYWDYEPNLVFYSKAEFIELFADCCRNYVANSPERREEFALAMAANGMTL